MKKMEKVWLCSCFTQGNFFRPSRSTLASVPFVNHWKQLERKNLGRSITVNGVSASSIFHCAFLTLNWSFSKFSKWNIWPFERDLRKLKTAFFKKNYSICEITELRFAILGTSWVPFISCRMDKRIFMIPFHPWFAADYW